jgi:hypothetical protein
MEGSSSVIQINLHPNGIAIIGHSDMATCSEVSLTAWHFRRLIGGLDALVLHRDGGNAGGYGVTIFDDSKPWPAWFYKMHTRTLTEWADEWWKVKVKIARCEERLDPEKFKHLPDNDTE